MTSRFAQFGSGKRTARQSVARGVRAAAAPRQSLRRATSRLEVSSVSRWPALMPEECARANDGPCADRLLPGSWACARRARLSGRLLAKLIRVKSRLKGGTLNRPFALLRHLKISKFHFHGRNVPSRPFAQFFARFRAQNLRIRVPSRASNLQKPGTSTRRPYALGWELLIPRTPARCHFSLYPSFRHLVSIGLTPCE